MDKLEKRKGMLRHHKSDRQKIEIARKNNNLVKYYSHITRRDRELQNGHKSFLVWFTGFSGSGKSTIAHGVERKLHQLNCRTLVLDGDNVRHNLCSDLGFSREDRSENIRRIGEVGKLFVEAGVIIMTAFISPYKADREWVRRLFPYGDFLEVYCKCSLAVCEQRDVKGHYQRARQGEILDFTGVSSPYEEPENPELVLDTSQISTELCIQKVISMLIGKGYLSASIEKPPLPVTQAYLTESKSD
jgi:adenylylsulfate kinase